MVLNGSDTDTHTHAHTHTEGGRKREINLG